MKTITGMPVRVKKALSAVLVARAAWDAAYEIDKESREEILRDNVFADEETGERITTRKCDFLMSEEDFARYCRLVYARNCAKGLDSGDPELTLWPAQKAVYDAEDAYIDAVAIDIPQFTPDIVKAIKDSPARRKQFFAIAGL